ncbi:GNAT family N-acetyltransferase [Bacillus sp. AK031]
MDIYLDRLKMEDAEQLFAFELENRGFFETMVPSRGADYYNYETFLSKHKLLLKEQEEEISFFFLIKNKAGEILGRMNLVDIDPSTKIGHIGYRVGKAFTGQGIASAALKLLFYDIEKLQVNEIHAKTTEDNLPSQKILIKNGFSLVKKDEESSGINERFLHYVRSGSLKK